MPESDTPWGRHFIGGTWCDPLEGSVVPTFNPATGESLGDLADGGDKDVERAVDVAMRAQKDWQKESAQHRGDALRELADRLEQDGPDFARLDAVDAGLPVEAMEADVREGIRYLRYFSGLGGEMKGMTLNLSGESFGATLREPFGVVGRIVPFNHPFMFAAAKIAAPIMAGNCVILKPSEIASLSALRIARVATGILPDGVLNVITGAGASAGKALAKHKHVTRIAATASVPVGASILADGAATMKRITLELGGKNAAVVFPDVSARAAAISLVEGMNFSRTMGQSCSSTSRAFIHSDIFDDVAGLVCELMSALSLGDPLDRAHDMGPVASRGQQARIASFLSTADATCLRYELGVAEGHREDGGYYVHPALFEVTDGAHPLAREEIFGPVLVLIRWSDFEGLVQAVNETDFGLVANILTNDLNTALRTAHRIDAGVIHLNGPVKRVPGIPFGGFRNSGIGKEDCLEELLSFTKEKALLINVDLAQGLGGPAQTPVAE